MTITGGSSAVIGSGTTIQVKLATTSQSGYLSSTDWTTFNSKIGGSFSTVAGGSLTFAYDIWYTSASATTPQITSSDIGKIIFIKNVNTAGNVTITGYASDTMDDHRSIGLGHGASGEGGIMIQATSTTTWYVLSTTGSITYS